MFKAQKKEYHLVNEWYAKKKKISSWLHGWTGGREGASDKITIGDCQSSQKQWDQDHKEKESEWTEMTNVFYERMASPLKLCLR